MQKVTIRAISLIALFIIHGCASLGTIIDHSEAQGVKRIAVLGLSIYQTSGAGPTVGFGNKNLTEAQKNREVQYEVLEELKRNIKEKTGWTVLDLDDLKKSKTYLEFYQRKNYRPRMVDVSFQRVQNLMDYHTASFLASDAEKLKAVTKELGIDAYALFSENQLVNNATVNIKGKRVKVINDNFSAQAVSSLRVLNIETGKVIYQVQNIEGEEIYNDNFEPSIPYRAKKDSLVFKVSKNAMTKLFAFIKQR